MIHYTHLQSPLGTLRLRACNDGLLAVDHACQQETLGNDWKESPDHPILRQATVELTEYFAGERRVFSVPLSPEGTEFQLRVWKMLKSIPFGETRSYSDIAAAMGKPQAARAVGAANGRNPLSIFVPCHRVIGKNGKLTGYAGGMGAKQFLLDFEISLAHGR